MKVLYVEDSLPDAELAQWELARSAPHINLEIASTLAQARAKLHKNQDYEVALIDLSLPDGNGLDLLLEIRRQSLPMAVIILTGWGDEENAVAALKAGADDYLTKNDGYLTRLPQSIAIALASYQSEANRKAKILRVLYVEHHKTDIDLTRRHLQKHAPHIQLEIAHSLSEALKKLPDTPAQPCPYDILLLDYRMPGENGLELIKTIRTERNLSLPIIFISGQGDEDIAVQALRLGAADYIVKRANYLYKLPVALENAYHRAELIRQQKALQASEERYRITFEKAPVGIAHSNLDGRWLWVNQQLCQITGYSKAELLAMRFQDISYPEDIEENIQLGRQLIAGKIETFTVENRYIRKDNSLIWVNVTVSLVHKDNGDPDYFIAVIKDISQRKQAQARYQTLIEQLPAISYMVELGESNRTIFISPQIEEILGFSPEEWLADPDTWLKQLHPDDREWVMAEVAEADAHSRPLNIEYRALRKDGQEVWLHNLNQPVQSTGKGGQIKHLHGVMFDITQRKQNEADIYRRNRELALLNKIINASSKATSIQATLEIACTELAQTFDLPQVTAVMLNEDKSEATIVAHYKSSDDTPSLVGQSAPIPGNSTFQYLMEHKSPLVVDNIETDPRVASLKELFQAQGTVSMLACPLIIDNQVVGGIGLRATSPYAFSAEEVQLVSSVAEQVASVLIRIKGNQEKQQLEAQFQQSQKMEAVGQLTAGIAHDFNNLLMAISGNTEIMQLRLRPEDPLYKMTETILKATGRAADLIRQLLIFSRKQIMTPQVVALNQIISEMNRLLERIIGENIEVTLKLGLDLWQIKIDPAQMEQVLVNLVVNARDAMPQGGRLVLETSNITLDESFKASQLELEPGNYVLLTVSDTGHGMPEEVRNRIFEPFFSTKPVGKGTGLGLSTVYGIIKQCGGAIWVYSEVDRGTVFKIYLPQTTDTPVKKAQPGPELLIQGTETILVVEDDNIIRKLARDVLSKQGYTVLEAKDGKQALEVASAHGKPIDLLLTDVILPGMNGKVLADELTQRHPQLKVIFVSGYADEIISQHGILQPGVVLLEKPFSFIDMARKVREALG